MVNFPTRIPDCNSHSPAFLDLFLSSDVSICSTMAFVLQYWEILIMLSSVSIDFPSNSQWDALFHCIAYGYSPAGWDGFCDYLMVFVMLHGRISLNSALLLLVNFLSVFSLELMYIFLIESIRSSLTHLHGFQVLVLLL